MIAYRPDIDGLRAVAILSVVAFHVQESFLPGGFTGVDIFFVISGFLITAIIHREMEEGSFTFTGFFIRRARRILPALFFLLIAVSLAALILLVPQDLVIFARLMSHAVIFAANCFLSNEKGYFEPEFLENPLLHVWSLSVEEQFYLIWPSLLLGLFLIARRHLLAAIIGLLIISLAWSESQAGEVAAFFLLPSRAFELLIGAALAIGLKGVVLPRRMAEAAGVAGFSLIGAGFLVLNAESRFPGVAALLPCLGAALLIASGAAQTLASRLLASRPLVIIGKLSYSWYLWHWPPLAFARYFFERPLDGGETALCLGFGFLMAYISWRYVETPFRRPETYAQLARPALRGGVAVVIVLIGLGSLIQETEGLPARLNDEAEAVYERYFAADRRELRGCIPGTRDRADPASCLFGDASDAPPRIVLWGDSHARSYLPALAAIAERHGIKGAAFISLGCRPVADGTHDPSESPRCAKKNAAALAYIKTHPSVETVILAARWARVVERRVGHHEARTKEAALQAARLLNERLGETVRAIQGLGREAVVLSQVPTLRQDLGSCLVKQLQFGIQIAGCLDMPLEAAGHIQQATWNALRDFDLTFEPVTVFSPEQYFCTGGLCRALVDGVPLYWDDDHINVHGARFIEPHLERFLAGILMNPAAGAQ